MFFFGCIQIQESIVDLKIFGPLLYIVRRESLSTPDSNVLRSHVGIVGDFGSIYKNPKYPFITNFKTYTLAAEAAGLVILGVPVRGGAWITLDGANLTKVKSSARCFIREWADTIFTH